MMLDELGCHDLTEQETVFLAKRDRQSDPT